MGGSRGLPRGSGYDSRARKNSRIYTQAVPYTGLENWEVETVKVRANKPGEISETVYF